MSKPIQVLLLTLLLAATSTAQFTTAYSFYGISGDHLGRSIAGVGDVNGDGHDDFIVGIPDSDPNGSLSGTALVISGLDGSTLHQFTGNVASVSLGGQVSGAGDVNNDGVPDLIVSMSGAEPNGPSSGRARVFSGADGSVLHNLDGETNGARMGERVCGAGDIDGDGFDDLIVSARYSDNLGALSRVFVFSGQDGSILHTFFSPTGATSYGNAISASGDLNGDGVPEILVGASRFHGMNGSFSGAVFVYSGFDGSLIRRLDGDSNDDHFGAAVGSIADLNGDGVDDILVGSPEDDLNGLTPDAGSVRVFSGADGVPLFTLWGDAQTQSFGFSVNSAGDVNLDGVADIIVGAPRDDTFGTDCGSATVFSGVDASVLFKVYGDNLGDQFGHAVCGTGDIDGDGAADIAVSAPEDDNFGSGSGSVRVYRAPTVSLNPIGGGQPNSPSGTLLVNNVPTGSLAGPFQSVITRGQYFSLDLRGAPLAFYEVYGSYTLNPGGWSFPGFGLFDLGTGPTFSDVFVLFSGFQGGFPYFSLDALGQSHQSFFVQPFLTPGTFVHLQALVQNQQPWQNGIWSTITAAHTLIVQ